MRIAIKFDSTTGDFHDGMEMVLFRAQMLRDVYYHEGDVRPSLDKFINEPLTRPDGQMFWVYRQGTFFPNYLFRRRELFVGYAFTKDLDESPEPTFEGYHHVPTLLLQGGGMLATKPDERFTMREQQENFEWLHRTSMYEEQKDE